MAPFTELALAIIAFLGSVNFIVVAAPSVTATMNGVQYETSGKATVCIDGVASVKLTIAAASDPRTVEHELLHIAQCRVDGGYDTGRPSSLDGGRCSDMPSDCVHSLVFWAQRYPDIAVAIIRSLTRSRP